MVDKVGAYLLLTPRCVDDDFPALCTELVQGLNNILSRKSENTFAFPTIVFSDDAVEIYGNRAANSPRLLRGRMSLNGTKARLLHLLSSIHLVTLKIIASKRVLDWQAPSGSFVDLGRSYGCHGPGPAVHVRRNLQVK